jgi:hypothetical protein
MSYFAAAHIEPDYLDSLDPSDDEDYGDDRDYDTDIEDRDYDSAAEDRWDRAHDRASAWESRFDV